MPRENEIVHSLARLAITGGRLDIPELRKSIESPQNRLPANWEVTARQVLRTLSALGIVKPNPGGSILLTDLGRAVVPGIQREQVDFNPGVEEGDDGGRNGGGGGGNGKNPPQANADGGDGDGDGAGVREVLAHPHLFAFSKEEFNDLLGLI